MAAIMVCSFIISNQSVFAVNGFYSGNDILFYDPNASNCIVGGTGSVNLVGNDNIEKALRYFTGKGLTMEQASGIAGNLMAESSIIPARIQGSGTKLADENYTLVNGTGFGIAQWTSGGRQKGLMDLSKSSDRKIIDLSLQLDYLWKELSGSYKDTLSKLKGADTPEDAAVIFHNGYEKSADSDERVKAVRGGIAKKIFDKFSSKVPDETTSDKKKTDTKTDKDKDTTKSAPVKIACTGDGTASSYVDGFAIFNQNDPQWADKIYGGSTTIGEAGCGPSAMAMIITALTGNNVTPYDTATYGAANGTYVDGHGSSHNIGSVVGGHWGLNSSSVGADVAQINEVLRSGGLILAVGTGSAPYTSLGHFIVIRGVTENGKWMVGDSNGRAGTENSSKEWDPASILLDGVNMWAITR